jgi:hypothetical protein
MYRVVGTSVNQRAWSRRPEANLAEEEARDEAVQTGKPDRPGPGVGAAAGMPGTGPTRQAQGVGEAQPNNSDNNQYSIFASWPHCVV